MSDDEKEASEDEITEDSEIEFEEEEDIEALPAVVVLEDSSEKERKNLKILRKS